MKDEMSSTEIIRFNSLESTNDEAKKIISNLNPEKPVWIIADKQTKGRGRGQNIWISEIILQQTRMEQGIYYYNRFISKFPDLKTLAISDEKDVLLLWQGLGYYSRARNLHSTSKYIFNQSNSEFPESYEELIKLKGIGDYTASAISSICFEKSQPVLDGNVFRIISRVYEIKNPIDH